MSLRCAKPHCAVLATHDQLAFYQDLNNSGWNLGLGPEFIFPSNNPMPPNIQIIAEGNKYCPYTVICGKCLGKVGMINVVCGFEHSTVNFSAKKVILFSNTTHPTNKWGKLLSMFPQIRKVTASIPSSIVVAGGNTIHFHGVADLKAMVESGTAVANHSNLNPRRYQWRAYFFSCLNNVLLCIPTGMGKTFIANMTMAAYRQRNPTKGQVFIVPTIVLVEQQAAMLEKNTGLRVKRHSGEHKLESPWDPQDISVCTPAMFVNALKINRLDMSHFSLIVLDEVHEAASEASSYGMLLPFIHKCDSAKRPRIMGLTASPSGINSTDMRATISSLCDKLKALPYSPLVDDDKNTDQANNVSCQYVTIHKSSFELVFEQFVFETLESLRCLHSFFNTNWNFVHSNVEIKHKINSAIKDLSHSRMVARNSNDLRLLQLTQWMEKWISSLDLLQICGPKKLINDIKADLEYATKSDALSAIGPELMPLFKTIQARILQLDSDPCTTENSPRVQELIRQIKQHQNDQERVLIFVERRDTAERLSRKLKDDPDLEKMNPDYVIGNSNGDFPKELQQIVLDKFHKGECQILVATSVLEQGIDVAACGIVVCFDGVKSMKSIIQSRGRARKKSAKFIVFVVADKQRKTNELSNMEFTMNLAIQQLMLSTKFNSTFTAQFTEEMEKFLETGQETIHIEDEQFDEEDDYEEPKIPDDLCIFPLEFNNFADSISLTDHIADNFNTDYDIVKAHKKKVVAKFAVSVDTAEYWKKGSQIVQNISSMSKYKPSSNLRARIVVPTSPEAAQSSMTVNFTCLSSFYFPSQCNVHIDANEIWSSPFTMTLRSNRIILNRGIEYFFIEPADVDGMILIEHNNTSYKLFIGLRSPPTYCKDQEQSPFNFNNRTISLCLIRNISINPEQSWQIQSLLMNFSLEIYYVCHLSQQNVSYRTEPRSFGSFNKNYLVHSWCNKYASILPPRLPDRVLDQFESASEDFLELMLDILVPERFQLPEIPKIKNINLPFSELSVPANYVMIGRVKVLPSRIIVLPMMPIAKNRVLRYFPDPKNFLIVSFMDEHDSNPWRSPLICDHFLQTLHRGIEIGGKRFTFLGCSNSQLREGRCWFSCLDRQMVYEKIGEFPDTMGAGRKLTRLALAFASSIETVPVNIEYLKNVSEDIINENGDVIFSDGIGRASQGFFNQIKRSMKLEDPSVCALQIRVGGIKGVITMFDERSQDVTFRKSMKKFESNHNMLEVLHYNRSVPLYLNRHVILLLSSFGIPDEVFLELQSNDLMTSMNALTDDKESLRFVKSRSKVFDWEELPKTQIVQEPFFRQILISNTIDLTSNIVEHAHISVEKGRVLMGVLDETNTLQYGEVYAHIFEEGIGRALDGRVLVFRNPSVLPSDIRVLNARSNVSPRLRSLYKNCLVFPSNGPDSHANECSGGDLDGDLYYVVWDHKLVPDIEIPGEKVYKVETKEPEESAKDNSENAILQFYCDYVTNNRLGIIANAHLAMADKFGMRDQRAIELACYVAAETDAPKKGFTVGKLNGDLLPTEYPDYMMKFDKPTYRSTTVLGEMFRQTLPILEILLEKRIISVLKINYFSDDFDDEGSIERIYSNYSFEIKKLMKRYELATEVDLFSGTPIWRKGHMSAYKMQNQLRLTVKENVEEFWKTWKIIFENWRVKINNNQDLIKKWYNRPKSSPTSVHSFSMLAMPYVEFEGNQPISKIQEIQNSVLRWISSNKLTWMHEWNKRNKAGSAVMEKLQGIECHFYGSSMLGLSEEYSDIDLYAANNNFANLRESLKEIDSTAVNMEKPHACVNLTYDSFPIDVTNFIGGVNKTYAFAEAFDKNPGFWSALRVLVEWARNINIVKSGEQKGFMTVVSFCHLFIYHATSSAPKVEVIRKPYSLARFDSWIESMRNAPCGQLIFDFLKHLSNHKNRTWIATRRDPHNNEPLIKEDLIEYLSNDAKFAIYILSVHEGDVQKLFKFSSKTRIFRIDKRYLNPKITGDREQKQCMKEIIAKCNPKKAKNMSFELLTRNSVYYLEVKGDNKNFSDVERGLNKIQNRIACMQNGRWSKKAFHVVNATLLIAEFGNGSLTEVCFAYYDSNKFMPQHTGKFKSVLKVRNEKNENWKLLEAQRYEKQFLQQLNKFHEKQLRLKKESKHCRFFGGMECVIRCGYHYLFNIPETLHNSFETVTLQKVEQFISKNEEAFEKEANNNIIEDQKNYNKLTLFQVTKAVSHVNNNTSLQLMSLNDYKKKSSNQKETELIHSVNKNTGGIRHSFYPDWSHGEEKVREFACQNGFTHDIIEESDYYTNISLVWRQRELVASCDREGMMTEIRHRPCRWLSATFKHCDEEGGDDIRSYLKTRAALDDDESCLETVIEYLNGRSVFANDYLAQIKHNSDRDKKTLPFSSRPLVPQMFDLNWKFTMMRRITPVMKFKNKDGDKIFLLQIDDGIFRSETRDFEWFPTRQELEIRLNMEGDDKKLCRKSFELCLNLFAITKKN